MAAIRQAKVQFVSPFRNETGRTYTYFTTLQTLKPGDLVVVDSQPGLGVAEFIEYRNDPNAKRWIVQKINMAQHTKNVKRLERVAEIRRELEERRKKFDMMNIYTIIAEHDPEAKTLLDELESLGF